VPVLHVAARKMHAQTGVRSYQRLPGVIPAYLLRSSCSRRVSGPYLKLALPIRRNFMVQRYRPPGRCIRRWLGRIGYAMAEKGLDLAPPKRAIARPP
jgi:hypothetical protein